LRKPYGKTRACLFRGGKQDRPEFFKEQPQFMANFLLLLAAAAGAGLALAAVPLQLYLSQRQSEEFAAVILVAPG